MTTTDTAPTCSAEAYLGAVAERDYAEIKLARAKEGVKAAMRSLILESIDNDDFELVGDLYWSGEPIAATLAECLGIPNQSIGKFLAEYAPSFSLKCGADHHWDWRPTSKSALLDARKGRFPYCTTCRQETSSRVRQQQAAHQDRLAELAAMPYREYLLTPEWQNTRKAALKRVRWACQVCARAVPLQVHHRTYIRRGNELPSDLVALCGECHKTFHANRELADGGRAHV